MYVCVQMQAASASGRARLSFALFENAHEGIDATETESTFGKADVDFIVVCAEFGPEIGFSTESKGPGEAVVGLCEPFDFPSVQVGYGLQFVCARDAEGEVVRACRDSFVNEGIKGVR